MRTSILLALALLAIPAVAHAGIVEGRVTSAKRATKKTLAVTKDAGVCGKKGIPDESLIVATDGALANAVASLEGVPTGAAAQPAEAKLDQTACRFIPHVQSATVGGRLVVHNSDKVLHNVHAFRGADTAFNIALPMPQMKSTQSLKEPGVLTLRCDAGHTWMSAHVAVFAHPYHAVSGKDGRFTIAEVPPGKYTLRVWHETLGERTAQVTVAGDGKASASIAF